MKKSTVEEFYISQASVPVLPVEHEKIPVITVAHYIPLAQLTALRCIEWIQANPEGVISLPAGKSALHFITWMKYYLDNWDSERETGMLAKVGISGKKPPSFHGLHFVQADEFFPIAPSHERSFHYFVKHQYIDKFGFNPAKALLFNTSSITLYNDSDRKIQMRVEEIFPEGTIELNLRKKLPLEDLTKLQKKVIKHFDQVCEEYEEKIRSLGGIGFFLSSIGADGNVAFNGKGASHHSSTRLTTMNYETMATTAVDLGGIEFVKKKAIITIGLETITFNPEATAIIFAAGETNAEICAEAIEQPPHIDSPASALQKLPNARFYLTHGASSRLIERRLQSVILGNKNKAADIDKLIIDGALTSGIKLSDSSSASGAAAMSPFWKTAVQVSGKSITDLCRETVERLAVKIQSGIDIPKPQRFLHTGPHHDDIELAYFPLIHHLVRSPKNMNYFCYLTSGFTSVTNSFVLEKLNTLIRVLKNGKLYREISHNDLYNPKLREIEIHGYLNAIAQQNKNAAGLFTAMRIFRHIAEELQTHSDAEVLVFVEQQIQMLQQNSNGAALPDTINQIKAWIRQWEAELAWAHFGLDTRDVHHLQLKFYNDSGANQRMNFDRDVHTIVSLLQTIKPTTITLAMDPEGSGPDTHYKTLLAIRAALQEYAKVSKNDIPRIWGYRNVWSDFHPADVSMIVLVSLNSFAVLHTMFNTCYLSQKNAAFPSTKLDGTFSELAQKIWVQQFNDLSSLLGKSHFYSSDHPMMRRAYGAIYLKDMSYDEFMEETKELI